MSSNVYANGREVSAKKDGNKSICAMPDVCLSPPSPPAGPVPIPYPNTSQASDTDQGTKTVKVGGDEVGMKNSSNYKKSNGDEAATKGLGMGVTTACIQGPSQHAAWSSDVKFEGANAIRHMDMTTHNHANPGNSASVMMNAGLVGVQIPKQLNCEELEAERQKAESNDLKDPKGVQPGQTHAAGSFTNGEDNILMKGVSHLKEMVSSGKISGYSPGRSWPRTPDKKPAKGPVKKACGEGGNHSPSTMKHAESRMIEDLISRGGQGDLLISIKWWPTSAKTTLDDPCSACNNLMCEAAACGLNVKFCKDGQPTDPSC
jgi:hypothetical protein